MELINLCTKTSLPLISTVLQINGIKHKWLFGEVIYPHGNEKHRDFNRCCSAINHSGHRTSHGEAGRAGFVAVAVPAVMWWVLGGPQCVPKPPGSAQVRLSEPGLVLEPLWPCSLTHT